MRRLPNGDLTKDTEVYSKAWRQLAAPMEKLLGAELTAFDPDFQFTSGQLVLSMPLWAVRRVVEGLKARGSNKAGGFEVKELTVHAQPCTGCGKQVHSMGPGRPRRTCPECKAFNRKLYNIKYKNGES